MNLLIISTVFAPWHILLLFGAMLLMFGGKKLPELMGGIGKGMKEFKKAIKDDDEPVKETPKETPKETIKDEPKKE
jgi:sec-independent protein translocase protein TatA